MGKNKDVVAIDIGSETLSLVHLQNAGTRKADYEFFSYKIKDLKDDGVADLLKKSFDELKIKNAMIVSVIPLNAAITKNLEIPSLNPLEIKEILDLQSGRQTPYAREEIIIDYVNIGTYRQNYTKILLVIVTRNVIKRQFEIAAAAGLKIDNVYFAPEGISANVLNYLRGDQQNSPVGVIHVDAHFSDFIVTLHGLPIFTRSIPLGLSHLEADPAKTISKFTDEIKRSLETYQSEDIEASVTSLLFCGAVDGLQALERDLSDTLHIPLQRIDYLRKLNVFNENISLPAALQNQSFFNASAVLSSLKIMKVSLVPEEIKMRRNFEERAREMIKMSVYFIAMFILIGSFFVVQYYFKNAYLQYLRTQFRETREEAKILEKSMERIRIIKHYLKSRGYALEVLGALYDVLPDRIMLSDIKMDTEGNLHIKGTARAMSDVFSFVVKLESADFFSNVQTNYTTSRKEQGEDWADFGISCVLKK